MSLRLTITADDGTELLVIDSNRPGVVQAASVGFALEPNNSCLALCTRAAAFLAASMDNQLVNAPIDRPRSKPELE